MTVFSKISSKRVILNVRVLYSGITASPVSLGSLNIQFPASQPAECVMFVFAVARFGVTAPSTRANNSERHIVWWFVVVVVVPGLGTIPKMINNSTSCPRSPKFCQISHLVGPLFWLGDDGIEQPRGRTSRIVAIRAVK